MLGLEIISAGNCHIKQTEIQCRGKKKKSKCKLIAFIVQKRCLLKDRHYSLFYLKAHEPGALWEHFSSWQGCCASPNSWENTFRKLLLSLCCIVSRLHETCYPNHRKKEDAVESPGVKMLISCKVPSVCPRGQRLGIARGMPPSSYVSAGDVHGGDTYSKCLLLII